jgi:hypothetical protein
VAAAPVEGTRPPEEEAAIVEVARALKLTEKKGFDCSDVVNRKVRLAYAVAPLPGLGFVDGHRDQWVAFARCAEKERYFLMMKEVSTLLVKASETQGHPELLARAYMGLGDLEAADQVLTLAIDALPKDANVALTAAKLMCREEKWKACLTYCDKAVTLADKLDAAEKKAVLNRAFKYGARAALHQGNLELAQTFITASGKLGGDEAELALIRQLSVAAKISQALVEPEYDAELPLGVYHLFGKMKDAGPLITLSLSNLSPEAKVFKAEVTVDGVTQRQVKTAVLEKGEGKRVTFSPPLSPAFNPAALRAKQSAQIAVKVTASGTAGDRVVYEESLPLDLQPRDFLPMSAYDGKDADHSTRKFYAAWVTPNARAVDAFLTKAKARVPGHAFAGLQADTYPQVKALFEELQAEGMSYVMDPEVLADDAFGQRTRLPSEVLQSTNAQCLEGTLLYASLLEAIGLDPLLIQVPGHIFVGWRPSPKDKYKAKLDHGAYFLETTATHEATFDQAIGAAINEFGLHASRKQAQVFDVAELRKLGVTPQPGD